MTNIMMLNPKYTREEILNRLHYLLGIFCSYFSILGTNNFLNKSWWVFLLATRRFTTEPPTLSCKLSFYLSLKKRGIVSVVLFKMSMLTFGLLPISLLQQLQLSL